MDDAHWSSLPDEMREQPTDLSWFEATSGLHSAGERVVSIGGFCDLRSEYSTDGSGRFSVVEFVELSTGRRVPIDERGFSIGPSIPSKIVDRASIETLESLTEQVLNTVLPDTDEDPDDHPWEWLAHQSRARGIDVSADELRALDYRVVFSERIHQWLESSAAH